MVFFEIGSIKLERVESPEKLGKAKSTFHTESREVPGPSYLKIRFIACCYLDHRYVPDKLGKK